MSVGLSCTGLCWTGNCLCWPNFLWKLLLIFFGYEICSIPNVFGFKIFNESILLGFNGTLHMHTLSLLRQQACRLPEWTSKKINELLWVSLNSMYGLKIPAGDKINPKSMVSPLTPDPLICRSPNPSVRLALCLSKTHKWSAGTTQQIIESHAGIFTTMKQLLLLAWSLSKVHPKINHTIFLFLLTKSGKIIVFRQMICG